MKTFLDGRVTLYPGDCRGVLKTLADNQIDSVVCDPPYGLMFMGKAWDHAEGAPFAVEFWTEVLRVLKPGGHVLAFSGTRTYHRLACAIEDAGFEIRDQIGWAYGSGFPKSHDVSKAMDKASGVDREDKFGGAIDRRIGPTGNKKCEVCNKWLVSGSPCKCPRPQDEAVSDAAREWQGWGTALKPAWEPIVVARKPLIGTVAENVLKYGTGAINIDECRIETSESLNGGAYASSGGRGAMAGDEREGKALGMFQPGKTAEKEFTQPQGRFPANIIHDGSEEVLACFPADAGASAPVRGTESSMASVGNVTGERNRVPGAFHSDSGSAARFFYTSKADAEDRLGSKHPTVKPLDLMQYLVRLVTPKNGTVLDPFAGTGTTGEAAWREGMNAILIEREEEYQADIARRMELATQPTKRAAVAKTKNKLDDPNELPLFAGGK